MEDKEGHAHIPCDKPPVRDSENLDCPHGIFEKKFPSMDNCFWKSAAVPDGGYKALCPHCGIWTSLPEGAALKVTHIFDCALMGYGKRVTEEDMKDE